MAKKYEAETVDAEAQSEPAKGKGCERCGDPVDVNGGAYCAHCRRVHGCA